MKLLNYHHVKLVVRHSLRNYSLNASANVRVRFAPSPTGYLHLGGLRTALYNYLFAKSHGGQFILRIEDTDQSRLVPGAAEQLEEVLNWIGLVPDESPIVGGDFGPYRQSQRLNIYSKYAQELIDKGLAYRCFCTEKRLELLKKEAARTRQPNKYDRKCYNLTPDEIEEKLASNQPHTIRFLLSPELHKFDDLVYGEFSHDVFATEGDPVIVKSDGFPVYHFANIVDDHEMRISHVLRGVEWQVSTPKHLMMYQALGWSPPNFGHLPLIMNNDGTKLSKRQNDLHLESLRKSGFFPDSILNFVTLVGGGFEEKENHLDKIYSLDELCQMFKINRMNTHNCKIDISKLDMINRNVLHKNLQDPEESFKLIEVCRKIITDKLQELELVQDNLDDARILSILEWAKDRISTLNDIVSEDLLFLWHLPSHSQNLESADSAVVAETVKILEDEMEAKSIMKMLKNLSKEKGIKFPVLMRDLRILLTGKTEGPPIIDLINILGKDKSIERLNYFVKNNL